MLADLITLGLMTAAGIYGALADKRRRPAPEDRHD